jgi:hypothetical protein
VIVRERTASQIDCLIEVGHSAGPEGAEVMNLFDHTHRRRFIAFSPKQLAIFPRLCFHDLSNASTEEVHMKKNWTKSQPLMVCAAAAAADHSALLG